MKRIIFLFVLLFALGSFEQVLACSCSGYRSQSPCEFFGDAKAVFIGHVISSGDETVFKVNEAFLGSDTGKEITLGKDKSSMCNLYFEKDKDYVVYAYEWKGILQAGYCSPTRRLDKAEKKDLDFLRGLKTETRGGRISGTAKLYAKSYFEIDEQPPMANLKIQIDQLDGKREKFEVVTDEKGHYELSGLATGTYKIALPFLPEHQVIAARFRPIREFTLNEKGCHDEGLFIENDSLLSFRITDWQGKPVNWLSIEILPVGIEPAKGFLLTSTEFGITDPDGTSVNTGIPPGKYTISINRYESPTERHPFPGFFYPNTTDRSQAKVFEIGWGTKIENIEIQLPPPLPMTKIYGKVVWKNGKPAADVFVDITDVEWKQGAISMTNTDSNGRFVLQGFAGRKYSLEAGTLGTFVRGKFVSFETKAVEFVLDENTKEFRLVLQKKKD